MPSLIVLGQPRGNDQIVFGAQKCGVPYVVCRESWLGAYGCVDATASRGCVIPAIDLLTAYRVGAHSTLHFQETLALIIVQPVVLEVTAPCTSGESFAWPYVRGRGN